MRWNHCTVYQWNLVQPDMKKHRTKSFVYSDRQFSASMSVYVTFRLITDNSLIIMFRVSECFQQNANASETHLSHRWARRSLAGSDRRGRRSLTGDTRRVRSDAPGRPAAPAADRSTGPGSLRCTCNCRTHPWACTRRDYIWKWSEKKD